MQQVSLIYQFWIHTETVRKLPAPLEWILNTPSHHRVHHASNALYLDKNMGMFLIIWDKMFGTFQEELPEDNYQRIKYGLTKPLTKPTPGKLIFHEWQSMLDDLGRDDLSFKDKLGYIFGPPGWSHDGSRQTSNELREMEAGEETGVFSNSVSSAAALNGKEQAQS